jgi:hypothetical protein
VKDSVQKRTASPITDEEKLWQKGDIEALNRSIEKKRDIPVLQLLSYCRAYNGSGGKRLSLRAKDGWTLAKSADST